MKSTFRAEILVFSALLSTQAFAQLAGHLPDQAPEPSRDVTGRRGGVELAVAPPGETPPEAHRTHDPVDVLTPLLASSGPDLSVSSNKATEQDEVSAPPVKVAAPTPTPDQVLQSDGTEQAGYRADLVSGAGFLDQTKIQDLPYDYFVAPSDLLENASSASAEKILGMMPTIQTNGQESEGDGERYSLSRGFFQNWAVDGMVRAFSNITGPIPLEDKERIEQQSGLSAFLSGGTLNIGGVTNYVLKRPTSTPLANITLGYLGGQSGYLHGDFGGPIGDGFGYRINVAGRDGDTSISNQRIKSGLVSGAFDARITDQILVQVDFAHYEYAIDGQSTSWSLRGPITPAAPNLSDAGPPGWTYDKWKTDQAGARLRYDFDEHFDLRAGFQYEQLDNRYVSLVLQNIAATGSYNGTLIDSAPDSRFRNLMSYAFADLKFSTFEVGHALTFGYSRQYMWAQFVSPNNAFYETITGFNYFDAAASAAAMQNAYSTLISEPPISGPLVTNYDYIYDSMPIADKIDIGHQWSLIAGGSYDRMGYHDYDSTTGAQVDRYYRGQFSPSASIGFKPVPSMSTYFTYQEGLTPGDIIPTTFLGFPVTNPGSSPPSLHREYELGVKYMVGQAMMSLAAFDMTEASSYYMANSAGTSYTYYGDGREEHKGADIGIAGKVTRNLTLYGGGTFMHSEITSQPSNPGIVGQQPAGVSNYMEKLYAEYAIERVHGLVLTAGVQNYSRFLAANVTTGSKYISGYAFGDIGARYNFAPYGHDATLRVTASNVTNQRYWVPRGIAGNPQTIEVSVEMHL